MKKQKTKCNHSPEEITEEFIDILDSKFFKTLSEPVRIELLKFLILHGCCDIGTITEGFPQDRSVMSRHLNLMHEVGLLCCEKRSRHVYYNIDCDSFLVKMKGIVDLLERCSSVCCKNTD